MNDTRAKQKLINLANALNRFEEALNEPTTNPLAVDGTIQRFEFVFELFWKTFKVLLELEGIETFTPKEALQQAFRANWLQDETVWLAMIKSRNETSHIYDEAIAGRIYMEIREYLPEMMRVYEFLKQKYEVRSDK